MTKRILLTIAAVLALTAGNLWADDKPAASTTPVAKMAAKPAKAGNPTIAAIQAAIDIDAAGNSTAAVAAFEKIETKSKNLEAWRLNDEAGIYLRVGDFKKAIDLLEKATASNDQNYVAWNNLGSAYESDNQTDKAKDAYQKSVDAAKAANASSAKAEGNLAALNARLGVKDGGDAAKGGDDSSADDSSAKDAGKKK